MLYSYQEAKVRVGKNNKGKDKKLPRNQNALSVPNWPCCYLIPEKSHHSERSKIQNFGSSDCLQVKKA
jgi:hypothetical protein